MSSPISRPNASYLGTRAIRQERAPRVNSLERCAHGGRAPRRSRPRPACAGRGGGGRPGSARPRADRRRAGGRRAHPAARRPPRPGRAARAAAARRRRPSRSTRRSRRPRRCRRRAGARAPRSVGLVRGQHRQHRDLGPRALGLAVERERRLERGERELVEPQRAGERMRAGGGDRLRAADQHARLRPAEQLVAGEADERGAGRDRAAHRRLVGQRRQVLGEVARADVVDHRRAELAQLLDLDLLHEPELAEVRRVRAQDRAGAPRRSRARSRRGACGWSCRPRRSRRAGLRDDLGDPEAAADLDELARARPRSRGPGRRAPRPRAAPRRRSC